MSYIYFSNKKTRTALNDFCVKRINEVQKLLNEYLTFQFFLIGSGYTKLLMANGNSKRVDLDYNLVIQSCDEDLIRHPAKLKTLFVNAFNDALSKFDNVRVHNSTSVVTSYIGNLLGYRFSFDCAVMVEFEDGLQKLVRNGANSYSWCKIRKSQDFQRRFRRIRKRHLDELKEIYLLKKNKFLDESSFSLLLETVNELEQRYGLR
ncbi:MAG: hypothetical protein MJ208_00185 [Bacilli bacterium]|nr:hypothetical protein [Bacilli bacterium]